MKTKYYLKMHDTPVLQKTFNSFTFTLDKGIIDFLRKFITFKRTVKDQYNFSQSDAIREGITQLKMNYGNIPSRPRSEKIPTRKGKAFGTKITSTQKKITTSFYLSENDREFIYDVIYYNVKNGLAYGKEDFINQIVEVWEKEYYEKQTITN